MKTIGAQLVSIEKGVVKIDCDFDPKLTQQHGYLHAGVITTIVDVACGYAALTTMDEDRSVLTVEFKTTFLRPAKTNKITAVGKVIKTGNRLTFCEGTVFDEKGITEIARMTATMASIRLNK